MKYQCLSGMYSDPGHPAQGLSHYEKEPECSELPEAEVNSHYRLALEGERLSLQGGRGQINPQTPEPTQGSHPVPAYQKGSWTKYIVMCCPVLGLTH